MYVFGYILRDPTSPQQKFHSTIATDRAVVLTRYGGTPGAPAGPASWRGNHCPAQKGGVAIAAAEVLRAWNAKRRTYSDVVVKPAVAVLPDGTADDSVYELFARASEEGSLIESAVDKAASDTFLAMARRSAETQAETQAAGPGPAPAQDMPLRLPDGERPVRPNGETYLPRDIGGHTDVALIRQARRSFLPVLLSGAAGTGKTALADAALPDLLLVSCHGDMAVEDLVGKYLPSAGGDGWVYHDGPLVRAMREGRTLCLDEINRMPPEVYAVLHPTMDGRGVLRVDARPDLPLVTAVEGFYVIGMYNPDDLGSAALSEAILSRFPVQVEVTTDYDAARDLGVHPDFVTLAENLATTSSVRQKAGEPAVWKPEMRELLAAQAMIDAGLGVQFAMAAMIGRCTRPEDFRLVRSKAEALGFTGDTALRTGGRVGW